MYANVTEDQKAKIISEYRTFMISGATNPDHGAMLAAHKVLAPRARSDNARYNAYAAALATLVMAGEIKLAHVDLSNAPCCNGCEIAHGDHGNGSCERNCSRFAAFEICQKLSAV